MASRYFANFPEITYTLSDGKVVFIKDFFRKSKIEKSAVSSIIDYTKYSLKYGERPDVLATNLYNNADLHWTFFLVNDIENYYDWYKDSEIFEEYITKKYQGQYAIANATTDIVSAPTDAQDHKFLLGEKVTSVSSEGRITDVEPINKRINIEGGNFVADELITGSVSGKSFTPVSVINKRDGIHHYKNDDGLITNVETSGFTSVSNYDYEVVENDKKREINIIEPGKIDGIVRRFEEIMSA